jgi:hypothetical protein
MNPTLTLFPTPESEEQYDEAYEIGLSTRPELPPKNWSS